MIIDNAHEMHETLQDARTIEPDLFRNHDDGYRGGNRSNDNLISHMVVEVVI